MHGDEKNVFNRLIRDIKHSVRAEDERARMLDDFKRKIVPFTITAKDDDTVSGVVIRFTFDEPRTIRTFYEQLVERMGDIL